MALAGFRSKGTGGWGDITSATPENGVIPDDSNDLKALKQELGITLYEAQSTNAINAFLKPDDEFTKIKAETALASKATLVEFQRVLRQGQAASVPKDVALGIAKKRAEAFWQGEKEFIELRHPLSTAEGMIKLASGNTRKDIIKKGA